MPTPTPALLFETTTSFIALIPPHAFTSVAQRPKILVAHSSWSVDWSVKCIFLGGWGGGVGNVKLWWMDIGWYCFWKVGNSNWQLLSLFARSCWMGFSKHAWSDNRRERKRSGNVPFCREPWRSVSQQSITFSILIVFLSRRTLETDLENVAANCWVGFFLQTCVSVGAKLPNNVFFVFLLKLSLSLI